MQFEHYAVVLALAAVVAAAVWTSRKGRKVAPLSMPAAFRQAAPPPAPVPVDYMAVARQAMRGAHEALQEAGIMMSITAQTDRAASGYASDFDTRIAPLVGSANAANAATPAAKTAKGSS